jgi:hypothetical protein
MGGFGREDNADVVPMDEWDSRSDECDMGTPHKVSARSIWLLVVLNCLIDIFVLRDQLETRAIAPVLE